MVDNHIPLRFAQDLITSTDIRDAETVLLPANACITASFLETTTKAQQSIIITVTPQDDLGDIVKTNITRYEQAVTSKVSKLGDTIPAGTTLFKQGENSREAFLLLSGEVDIYILDKRVTTIQNEGAFIGEMAAIRSTNRSATAIAKSNCRVHRFDGSSLLLQAKQQPLVMVRLCRNLAQKLSELNKKVSEIATSSVSEKDITVAFENELVSAEGSMTKTYPAGAALFHQGETSLDLYIL